MASTLDWKSFGKEHLGWMGAFLPEKIYNLTTLQTAPVDISRDFFCNIFHAIFGVISFSHYELCAYRWAVLTVTKFLNICFHFILFADVKFTHAINSLLGTQICKT